MNLSSRLHAHGSRQGRLSHHRQFGRGDHGQPGDPDGHQRLRHRRRHLRAGDADRLHHDAGAAHHLLRSGSAAADLRIGLRLHLLRHGALFAITGALSAYLIVHIFAGTAETILSGIMALVNFEHLNTLMESHNASGWSASGW